MKKGLLLFLILSVLAFTGPEQVEAEQLPIKTYSITDGLSRENILRIFQDSHGFLWFCTTEGLSRFDGYEFINYGVDQGLPHRVVYDILETRSGDYWIATQGGLSRFNPASPHGFEVYNAPGEERARVTTVLFEDREGTLWCGTGQGLYRIEKEDGRWALRPSGLSLMVAVPDDNVVSAITEDQQGALWVGTLNGLYRFLPEHRTERFSMPEGLPSSNVTALLSDQQGCLWVATTSGIAQFDSNLETKNPHIARTYTEKDGLGNKRVNSLLQTSDGRILAGTVEGLSELNRTAAKNEKPFHTYTMSNGLSDRQIQSLSEDKDGNLWIGSESGGAMKMARNGFTTYTEADGLGAARINSIFEDGRGQLCVWSGGAVSYFGRRDFVPVRPRLRPPNATPGWGWNQVTFQDSTGQWWVPTAQGLYRYPKTEDVRQLAHESPLAVYTSRDGLTGDEVFRLFEDSHGDIWIGTISLGRDVLTRWERATETFHRYAQADGLPPSAPTAFSEDAEGRLWIGFYDGGLARYQDGRFTLFTTADGLPPGMVRSLYLDRAGHLWIATADGGLSCIEETTAAQQPRFVTYTTADGLSSNQITCITEDAWGRLYIGTGRGLDRLDPQTRRIKHYTTADGLASNFINTAHRDRSGALWFGTLQGLSRLLPEPAQPSAPPPIFLAGLNIAGVSYPLQDFSATAPQFELDADQNRIQIDFFGLSFSPGEVLQYQYRLEGTGEDWSAPTKSRRVNFANLAPGSYRFLVRAVNADDLTSSSPAAIAFVIKPPVWQRWWFLTVATLLVGAVVYGVDRYRVARMKELDAALSKLHISETRFRTVIEQSPLSTQIFSPDGRTVMINQAFQELWGTTLEQLQDRSFHADEQHQASGIIPFIERGVAGESISVPPMLLQRTQVVPTAFFNGDSRQQIWVRSFIYPVKDESNRVSEVVLVQEDITERKRAEENLRRVKEERLAELERVRRRIAADLHDDIGSSLTQIAILSEVVRQRVGDRDESVLEPLSLIAGASRELMDSMSDIVWAINPQKDHLENLVQKMRRFASDVLTARNIELHFDAQDAQPNLIVGANMRREIYLIFKESINNMARHSSCTRAIVELLVREDRLLLRVKDNGRGFDPGAWADGHGLKNMRERTRELGGQFEIDSGTGTGTAVTLSVPLAPQTVSEAAASLA